MYECWAWIEGEWLKGWDVGTATVAWLGHVTVFKTCLHPCCDEHFTEDWQLHYGKDKPTHKGSEHEFLDQVLKSI